MRRQSALALLITGLSVGMSVGAATAGDVNVNIGTPPLVLAPPAVVVAPPVITTRPQLVAVPGTGVYTAPHVDFNVFLFGGKYYSHHNDVWFVSPRPGARWTRVAFAAIPDEVRGVPVTYYKVKPKHAKHGKKMKHGGDHPGKGWKER